MEGHIESGKLVYFYTDKGEIQIESGGGVLDFKFDPKDFTKYEPSKWEDLLGCTVECTVIDDKVTSIYRTEG